MAGRAFAAIALAAAAAVAGVGCDDGDGRDGAAAERPARSEADGASPAPRAGAPERGRRGERQASGRRGDRHARAAARRSPTVKRVEGTLARAGERRVVIRPAGAPELTLRIAPDTTVTVDGRPTRLEALREGAPVRASYETGSGGRPTAIAIEARAAPEPAREGGDGSWSTSPDPEPTDGG